MANNTKPTKQSSKPTRAKNGGLNTNYLTKMGLRNLIVNRTMTLSSVSVLTACLLLIGVSFLLVFNITALVKDVEKQNIVVAFAKDDATEEEVVQIQNDLGRIKNVVKVKYVSKEEGFKEQLEDFNVDENLMEGVIENLLPDSFRITVENIDEFDQTLEAINNVNNVQAVRESQEIVNQISTLQKSIMLICVILVSVLVVVSLFIIGNTIRITMVSRKIDIQVMKSVGATNAFISWPFMIEGVFIGIISGLLAMGMTYALQASEGNALNSLLKLFGARTFSFMNFWPYFFAGYIVAGILLGAVSSVFSLKRYLRKEGSESALNS